MSSAEDTSRPPSGGQAGKDVLGQAFFRDRNLTEEALRPGDSRRVILSRLLKYVLPICLLLAGVDVGVRFALPPEKLLPYMQKEFAYYTLKLRYFKSLPPPEVLLLGSSRIRDDVRPEILARSLMSRWNRPVRVYNLGLGGSHMEEVYTIASSYLPDPPPKYVIIGFSGTEVAWNGHFRYASRFLWNFENFVDYLLRMPWSDFKVMHVEFFIESQICRAWYLFAQRDALCTYIWEHVRAAIGIQVPPAVEQSFAEERDRLVKYVYAKDGWYPVLPDWKDLASRLQWGEDNVTIQNRRELISDPGVLNDSSAILLRLTIAKLKAAGCKVALIETPPSPYMQSKNPVLHGPGFRKWMSEQADTLGAPFFAFPNEEYGLTNDLYGDASHLSEKGANHFTMIVFKRLWDAGFFEEGKKP